MKLLAFDTSTEALTVALALDVGENPPRILGHLEHAPRRHAELLLPTIERLLRAAGIDGRELDGIAVGRGPGAFTGVRLGVAAAQGLAYGWDVPLIGVSTLQVIAEAAAARARELDANVLALIDARMGEVYAAEFAVDVVRIRDSTTSGEYVLAPENVIASGPVVVIGTGIRAYRERFSAALRAAVREEADAGLALPQPAALLAVARGAIAQNGFTPTPSAVQPVYLRDRVAEPKPS